VDRVRFGRSLRALRLRRGLRQVDVAAKAGASRSQVSRIERGELRGVPVDGIVAMAAALGAEVELGVRWHGEGLDRLLDGQHAAIVEAIVGLLGPDGWECAVEVSFSIYGERGSVDVLAFHPATGTVLVVEVKSVVPDAQSLLASHDRKLRLALRIAAARGWTGRAAACLLVVPEGTTARRRIAALDQSFRVAYPVRGVAVRRWLRAPAGPMSGLLFLPDSQGDGVGRRRSARKRVTGPRRPRGVAE
jgi:transcriptional regulator with XRE-family HTH domain